MVIVKNLHPDCWNYFIAYEQEQAQFKILCPNLRGCAVFKGMLYSTDLQSLHFMVLVCLLDLSSNYLPV